MKIDKNHYLKSFICVAFSLSLIACASKPAPNFRGKWKTLNTYSETANEIKLRHDYIYYASPIDRSLKNMLERWADDSNINLVYQNSSDFTLHKPTAMIRSPTIQQAISELNDLYKEKGVAITLNNNQIIVSSVNN